MRPDLPAGVVTFLFTDVEGSTRLLRELGAVGYGEELAEHRRVVREACSSRGGVEVDTQGDAFFFAFPTARGALSAAQALASALDPGPIRVRVGLHTGRPHLTSEGYVGDDVHFAARVAASGHGGQILVSAATAELIESPLTSLGSHRLKDIPEPVTLYQLGERAFPALKTVANSNLPTPASSFLGRERELAEANLLLQGTRLLTVHGPGGQGKTRFALELARRAREERFRDYEDGVFACFLASLRDPGLVLPTIAQTLSVREEPDRSALETLASQLQGKRMLLLLDNVEHLLACAPKLSQLLARCPGLTLVVTSRERPRLQGELAYELPPLAEEESLLLFCERARVSPSEPIRALCERLEGLPLAIELAAARMRILSPEQLAARLAQRLDLLKGGRDADPRQQTLRATIEWSYDLLTPAEQELFASLAVFQGGCTLEAAEEVCEADLDTLESLVEKSLLRYSEGRFWMLETIREYARERLEETGEATAIASRSAAFYVELARRNRLELGKLLDREWADDLDVERDNLRSAFAHSLAAELVEDAHSLAVAYGRLCSYRGPASEGRSWLEAVLGNHESVGTPTLQQSLLAATGLAHRQRDDEAAGRYAQEALEVATSAADADGIAQAQLMRGLVEANGGNFERAQGLLQEALARSSEIDNEPLVREALGMLGWLAIARGDYAEARDLCREALDSSREAGDERGVLLSAGNLGHALAQLGEHREALRLQIEALQLARSHLELNYLAGALVEIAAVAALRHDLEEAAILIGASDALYDTTESLRDSVTSRVHANIVERLKQALDPAHLADATSRGGQMELDDVVSYALDYIDSS